MLNKLSTVRVWKNKWGSLTLTSSRESNSINIARGSQIIPNCSYRLHLLKTKPAPLLTMQLLHF